MLQNKLFLGRSVREVHVLTADDIQLSLQRTFDGKGNDRNRWELLLLLLLFPSAGDSLFALMFM